MARTGTQSLFAAQDLVILGSGSVGGDMSVGGTFSVVGQLSASVEVPAPMPTNVLTGIGNVLTTPGYYTYQSANVQALMPSASLLPGAMFVFGPYVPVRLGSLGGTNIILTGSSVQMSSGPNGTSFCQQSSGSSGGTGTKVGNNLTTATSGSVGLMSDGVMWNVLFSSGSLTIA